jgi:hypothetical protein
LHLTLLRPRWWWLHLTLLRRRRWRLHLSLLWRRGWRLHLTLLWRRRRLAWLLWLFLFFVITLRRLR